MPKFLRGFRRLFIEENKLQKYLLYAIGEIVLLVIGILLALQINNWNNDRSDRKKELAYIKSFLTDLENDRASLLEFKVNAMEIARQLDTFMEFSDRDFSIPSNNDSLHFYFRKAMKLRTWTHNDRTLNQLESNADYILLQPNVADSISVFKQKLMKLEQQGEGCKNSYRNGIEVANKYLHRHLIRYSSEKYMTFEGELTGKHLPPIPDDPVRKIELFNQAAHYQGCLLYYIHVLVDPLMDYTESLIIFLRQEYNLPPRETGGRLY